MNPDPTYPVVTEKTGGSSRKRTRSTAWFATLSTLFGILLFVTVTMPN